ncbi:MAG: SMP-30/gluconolactonase/LRE family protein [Deltaproteobacteria bacterium]
MAMGAGGTTSAAAQPPPQGDDSDGEPGVPNPPPAMTSPGVGRVGAELCPPGPFGAPLPATPTVTKLFSVGENNFFNFEGAVWVNDALYFSEIGGGNNPPPSNINRFIPGGTLERGVLKNTGSNGLAVDAQGNLIAATHDVGAISTFALPGGARGPLGAQTFNGTRFNSPNDLVQRKDGNVYFTDPSFQAPGNPQGSTRVYRIPPQGAATVVDDGLSNPNGITLSPDGNTLYVTSASGFRRYAVAIDGSTSAGATINLSDGLQTPDGMAMDCAGNVYTIEHSRRLIRVFGSAGNELGRFGGPQSFDRDITNMAFGGPNRSTLFVTSLTQGTEGGVFSVELNIPGFPY